MRVHVPRDPRLARDGGTLVNGKYALTTMDMYRLDQACHLLTGAFGNCTYLVGSVERGGTARDVDVRTILDDDTFDAIFGSAPLLWAAFSVGITSWLRQQTSLPIDYQVQRCTEANAKHDGPRNPLGRGRVFAGYGDATPF